MGHAQPRLPGRVRPLVSIRRPLGRPLPAALRVVPCRRLLSQRWVDPRTAASSSASLSPSSPTARMASPSGLACRSARRHPSRWRACGRSSCTSSGCARLSRPSSPEASRSSPRATTSGTARTRPRPRDISGSRDGEVECFHRGVVVEWRADAGARCAVEPLVNRVCASHGLLGSWALGGLWVPVGAAM